jgi:hypothetical protein
MSHCALKSLPFQEGFAFDYSSCLPDVNYCFLFLSNLPITSGCENFPFIKNNLDLYEGYRIFSAKYFQFATRQKNCIAFSTARCKQYRCRSAECIAN